MPKYQYFSLKINVENNVNMINYGQEDLSCSDIKSTLCAMFGLNLDDIDIEELDELPKMQKKRQGSKAGN